MLLTDVITPDGELRVYFTRVNSIISYFDEDEDGNVIAHAEYGEFACPYNRTEEKLIAMKQAMLIETARRLHVRPDQVELMTLNDIVNVCDAPLKEVPTWSGRTRSVTRGRR